MAYPRALDQIWLLTTKKTNYGVEYEGGSVVSGALWLPMVCVSMEKFTNISAKVSLNKVYSQVAK